MEKENEIESLNLLNIGKGALPELFQREIDTVLANIADVNTEQDQDRKITMEVVFTPFKDRDGAQIGITFKTKLAGVKGVASTVFINKHEGRLVAVPEDQMQRSMFGTPAKPGENVVAMSDKKKGVN